MSESDRLLEATTHLVEGSADPSDHALLDEAHPVDIAGLFRQLLLAFQDVLGVTIFLSLAAALLGWLT